MKKGRLFLKNIIWGLLALVFLIGGLTLFWFLANIRSPVQTNEDYISSETCGYCHYDHYATWVETAHAKAFQVVSAESNPIIPAWEGTLTFSEGDIHDVQIRLEETDEGFPLAILVDSADPSIEKEFLVTRISGGHGWKQRFYTYIEGDYYMLPMDWNQSIDNWTPLSLQFWWREDGSLRDKPPTLVSWSSMCAGCHETGLVVTYGFTGYQEYESTEAYIGCEKCHGPGQAHLNNPGPDTIINPSKLTFEKELEACGQCHSYGNSVPLPLSRYPIKIFGGETYRVGENLDDYRKNKPILWEGTEFSKKHRQQYTDHLLSGHNSAEIGCSACHSPHGTEHEHDLLAASDNRELCLSCHADDSQSELAYKFEDTAAIDDHTQHPIDLMDGEEIACTSCHQQDATYSAALGDGTSHHFTIVSPQVSLDMFNSFKDRDPVPDLWSDGIVGHNSLQEYLSLEIIPNSCNECHTEWKDSQDGYQAGVEAFLEMFPDFEIAITTPDSQ